MEEHCDQERYPSLVKLCTAQKDAVKTFISNFETVESAKANLQYKMKLAFKNSRGRKKRGPGLDVDLNLLYTEAKATTKITATGWRTLETAVSVTGDTYMAGQVRAQLLCILRTDSIYSTAYPKMPMMDMMTMTTMNTVCQNDSMHTKMHQGKCHGSKDFMLTATCKRFCKSDVRCCSIKTYYAYWLYRSLSDVLFMKENEFSRQQISYFGLAELDHLHNAIVSKCMDPSVKFSTSLYKGKHLGNSTCKA